MISINLENELLYFPRVSSQYSRRIIEKNIWCLLCSLYNVKNSSNSSSNEYNEDYTIIPIQNQLQYMEESHLGNI